MNYLLYEYVKDIDFKKMEGLKVIGVSRNKYYKIKWYKKVEILTDNGNRVTKLKILWSLMLV